MDSQPIPVCYITPPGFIDEYFIYAFEAGPLGANLTSVSDYANLQIPLYDGYDFIARRVVGLQNIVNIASNAGKWRLRDYAGQFVTSAPVLAGLNASNIYNDFLLIPEMWYPHAGRISFDIYAALLTTSGVAGPSISTAQLAFAGVRRRSGTPSAPQYKYKLKPYTYKLTFALNQVQQPSAGVYNPFQRIFQNIEDFDFELWSISMEGGPSDIKARITLHNAARIAVSNMPIIRGYMSDPVPWASRTNATVSTSGIGAIVPPLVYPHQSSIQLDIYSMLQASQIPATLTFNFTGAQRIPC